MVTVQEAVLFPSAVLTVILALPALTASTEPLLTVATDVSLLDQVTFLFVALDGLMLSVNVNLSPTYKDAEVLFNETDVTEIDEFLTVTVQEAVILDLLLLVAVILEVPSLSASILPS